jgi:Cu2+-exporting ATPase
MLLSPPKRANLASTHAQACAHCGSPVPDNVGTSIYCCAGCEAVAALLRSEELTRYYAIAGGDVLPDGAAPARRSHAWLEPLLDGQRDADTPTLELDVQGIHCAACVWLMNETFRRLPGGVALTVNPALGKARLTWRRGAFEPEAWLDAVERFGYQFGPSRKTASAAAASLTWRLGVALALTMNEMLFSVSFYFGLGRADGALYTLFSRLALLLSTGVVIVGGWPFLAGAARGLRSGILHLDLPIALGIVLVYVTSLVGVAGGRGGELAYFDTLDVFITLMLLGRFLQQRLLDRNRQLLLADDGAEGLVVRRLDGEGRRLAVVPAPTVRVGDRLLVAPGELVPVAATLDSREALDDAPARVSTDWITGEAEARTVAAGSRLLAGSFNAGATAFTVVAAQDFADSPLVALLRQTSGRAGATDHLRFWDLLARRWVVAVLAVAGAGFASWLPRSGARALDVAVALLVVTCPCAIGIALPLAYEIIGARLRRAGFFPRTGDLLDRLERVRKVVFDKTGTLTLQRLELVPDGSLERLGPEARAVAYNLACRSAHPVSACLAAALARAGADYDPAATVVEVPGAGLAWARPDGLWRLGRADWAAPQAGASGTVLAHDSGGNSTVVGRFATREALRGGAAAEIAALQAAGYAVHLLSGDAAARVDALAAALGIPAANAKGDRTPDEKAADLAAIGGGDALYLGDGANDALAFGQALCAGTVAIERPILPGRSDFFLLGESLAPVRAALAAAHRLRRVARVILAIAVAYNVVAVSTALAGLMSPVRAAVFMPLSSLSILLLTVTALRQQPRAAAAQPALALEPAR